MKIITIGASPYLLASHAKIHSEIIKLLYFNNYDIASIVWGHDINYFLPKENSNGEKHYYYDFDEHSIPLIPFDYLKDPSIAIYEILEVYNPEMVITIGDYNDFLYMKAVRMFSNESFKWLAVLANHTFPINEKNLELIDEMDGILCTQENSYNEMKKLFKKEEISFSYIGCPDLSIQINEKSIIRKEQGISDKFRIINCGKNLQSDNIPMVMEAVKELRNTIPEIQLYVHSNIYDKGEYDLQLIRERFDPNGEFILFPNKYVSLADGYPTKDFEAELVISDIIISPSFSSSSGILIFEALSCGCLPLMSDTGCHREIAQILANLMDNYEIDDFLIPCIKVMTSGETYISICNSQELQNKIINMYHKKNKKGGNIKYFQQFVRSYHRNRFFKMLKLMIDKVKVTSSALCVESV